MAKFKNLTEYYEWCDKMVGKIYYADIAMNIHTIRDVVSEIASVLHVREGDHLIEPPDSPSS